MNYFEFYEIPVSFLPDEALIKHTYFRLSKAYHPDFYTLESEDKQAEILELSTQNNNAYKVLSNFDSRMKYILELKGVMDEEGKAKVPQDFLMEMMDINEALMELQFDFDKSQYDKLISDIETLETELLEGVQPALESYNDEKSNESELLALKDYYLKKRYLLRLRENLDKFADA
ncbi:MAG: iron-sulfur cluster co-chaperone HscB C-terminal domain-containing protein [Bacteroidota bacterium]